jgi:hypothetical protein
MDATELGNDLYIKHGFKEVDRVVAELEQFGGYPGQVSIYALLMKEPDIKVNGTARQST